MNQNALQKRLIRYQGEVEQLGFWLGRAKRALPASDFETYCNDLRDASHIAERLACGIRETAIDTCFVSKKQVLAQAAQVHGITIEQERDWYKIILPGLLPKKRGGSCAFIVAPLTCALAEFAECHPIERLVRCVVCFRHLYSPELPERAVRDHDNFEVKQVLDAVADQFLVDDTGLLCTNLYTTALADREATEVYVMPPESLPVWVEMHPIKAL